MVAVDQASGDGDLVGEEAHVGGATLDGNGQFARLEQDKLPSADRHAVSIMKVDMGLGILEDKSFAGPIGEVHAQSMHHVASAVENVGREHLLREGPDDVVADLDLHGDWWGLRSKAASSMAVHGARRCHGVAGTVEAIAHSLELVLMQWSPGAQGTKYDQLEPGGTGRPGIVANGL